MMEVELNEVGSEAGVGGSFVTQTKGERVQLSISGFRFVTERGILQRLPESRLATLCHEDPEFDQDTNSYFFERNPLFFPYILSAYKREGRIHLSHELCPRAVFEELDFWQIPRNQLSPCCWTRYQQLEEDKIAEDVMRQETKKRELHRNDEGEWSQIYWMLTDPTSSTKAKVWCGAYSVLALVSCLMLCIATLPMKQRNRNDQPTQHSVFFSLNFLLFLFFVGEWCARLTVCPTRILFLRSALNINDIITAFLLLIIHLACFIKPEVWRPDHWLGAIRGIVSVFFMLRLVRVFVYLQHVTRVRVILSTILHSLLDLLPILVVVGIGTLLAAVFAYYSDINDEDSQFRSIPSAAWWALVTVTTVGYGDSIPMSFGGKAVGAIWAIVGLLLLVLPVPFYMRHFERCSKLAHLRAAVKCRSEGTPWEKPISTEPAQV